jgi:hypothetical protein
LALEPLDPVEDRFGKRVCLGSRRPDQGDLQGDAGFRGVAHGDDRAPDELHHAHAAGCPEGVGDLGRVATRAGRPADLGGADETEEVAAQPLDDLDCELSRIPPLAGGSVDRDEGGGDVTVGERGDERGEGIRVVLGGAAGGDLVEHGERVAGRTAGAPDDRGEGFAREVDARVVGDPGDE